MSLGGNPHDGGHAGGQRGGDKVGRRKALPLPFVIHRGIRFQLGSRRAVDRRAVQLPLVTDGNFNQGSRSILPGARAAGPCPGQAQKEHDPGACCRSEQDLQKLEAHRTPLVFEHPLGADLQLGLLGVRLLGQLDHELSRLEGGAVLLVEIGHDALEFRRRKGFHPIHRGFELPHLGLALARDLFFRCPNQAVPGDQRCTNHQKEPDGVGKRDKRNQPHEGSLDRQGHDAREGQENPESQKRDRSAIHQTGAKTEGLEGSAKGVTQQLKEKVDACKSKETIANNADNLGGGRSGFHKGVE